MQRIKKALNSVLKLLKKSEEVSLSQAVNQSPARQTTSTVNTDKSFPSRPDSVENSTISSSANAGISVEAHRGAGQFRSSINVGGMSNYRAAGVSNESYPAVVPDKSQAFFTDSRPSKSLPFQMHIGDNASNCGSFCMQQGHLRGNFPYAQKHGKKKLAMAREKLLYVMSPGAQCFNCGSEDHYTMLCTQTSQLMQKSSFSSPFPQSSIASQRVTNADSLISVAACSESIQEKEKRVELCQDTLVNDEETDLTLKLSMIVPKKAVQTMLAANELSLEAKYKVTVKLENAGNAIKLSLIGLRKDVFRCFLDVGSHFPRNERDFDLEVTKFGQSEQHSADIDGSVAQIGSSAVLVETAKASAISPEIGVQEGNNLTQLRCPDLQNTSPEVHLQLSEPELSDVTGTKEAMQIKALPADVEISEVECGKGLLLDELAYNGSERESYVDVFINEDQGYKTQSDHDGKDLTYFEFDSPPINDLFGVSQADNGRVDGEEWSFLYENLADKGSEKKNQVNDSITESSSDRTVSDKDGKDLTCFDVNSSTASIDIGVSLANSGRAEAKEGSLLDVQQADKAPKSGSDVSIPENPSDGVLGDYDNKDVTTFEICVPREIVPCCEKGVLSIYHIRKKSGAKISRKKKNETQHMITVTGTADQVEMAVSCMQQNLMQSEEGECYLAEEGGNWNIGSAQLEMKSYA